MLEARDLAFGFGARRVGSDVTFALSSGETLAVLGGNGADGSPHSAHLPLGRMVAAAPNLARPVDNESRDLGELFNDRYLSLDLVAPVC